MRENSTRGKNLKNEDRVREFPSDSNGKRERKREREREVILNK